jgi:hypothetical protein
MPRIDPDRMVIIEAEPDGRYTFQVKFKGALGPKSRPMELREDAELLGNTLTKHLEHNCEQWLTLATLNSAASSPPPTALSSDPSQAA